MHLFIKYAYNLIISTACKFYIKYKFYIKHKLNMNLF